MTNFCDCGSANRATASARMPSSRSNFRTASNPVSVTMFPAEKSTVTYCRPNSHSTNCRAASVPELASLPIVVLASLPIVVL